MRQIIKTGRFIKDLKKAIKTHKNITKLKVAINLLHKEGSLPRKYKPHKLSGNWHPKWECHIEPDFLLIYELKKYELALIRVGSHSELFSK